MEASLDTSGRNLGLVPGTDTEDVRNAHSLGRLGELESLGAHAIHMPAAIRGARSAKTDSPVTAERHSCRSYPYEAVPCSGPA